MGGFCKYGKRMEETVDPKQPDWWRSCTISFLSSVLATGPMRDAISLSVVDHINKGFVSVAKLFRL